MAIILLRNARRILSLTCTKNVSINAKYFNRRFIMTTPQRVEKVLENLRKNPYFDKYAEKIAKLQQTSPEEFIQRVESQEKQVHEKKVTVDTSPPQSVQSLRTFPFTAKSVQLPWSNIRRRHYAEDTSRKKLITTPIFYVNAGPHIGHLYTAILADAISRYNSMLGLSVLLCTGTDEHGTKVHKAASTMNLPVLQYCTQISRRFQEMCNTFDVDYSRFVRTSEEQHRDAVHHFWTTLEKSGHIYLGKYSGWYCESDEAFLNDTELVEAQDSHGKSIKVSLESGNPVEWTEEETYKFRLSSLEEDLRHWLRNENTVKPAMYHKILCNWIEEGICQKDLSISRPINRVPWAIPTPCDNSHSIYVWFDALVNYLTAVGYPDDSFKKSWPPAVQVIGKDILKFHGIYWPAFLIAAGLEPPERLVCHAHWTVDDQKMSKSRGNVVSPFEAMNTFTQDGLRYFLLRQAVPHSDGNYNVTKIQRVLNSELANTLGNLINRCLGAAINPSREIPDPTMYANVLRSDIAAKNKEVLENLSLRAQSHYEEYNLHHVVDTIVSMFNITNQMIDYHKPWQLVKKNDTDSAMEAKAVISLALESVRVATLILYPIVPRLACNVLDLLQVPKEARTWHDTRPLYLSKSSMGTRCVSSQNTILFRKIN